MRTPPIVVITLSMGITTANAQGQSWSPPTPEERCPSRWGEGDERGAGNHMGPESVLRATQLIQTGEVIELGQTLNEAMPLGDRHFDLHMKPTRMNPGTNRRGSNEELVVSEMGQVGTQFDGFGHQTIGDSLYNCYNLPEVMTRTGFTHLGVENVGTLMTRGVLIDIAGLKSVTMLPDRYEITVSDLQEALERQQTTLEPGDAVLINTGWGTLWNTDPERFSAGGPGIGVEAAQWLIDRDPMLLGSDNFPVEVSPNPDPQLSLPVHQMMLVVHGIHLVERMKLDTLAATQVHEFAFVIQPLKLQGATGSTVAPIAIH
ncbi:MAG: cyclase [Acidobacteria bacterium]|nr:cyclase [Acidobacteriota bacterium]